VTSGLWAADKVFIMHHIGIFWRLFQSVKFHINLRTVLSWVYGGYGDSWTVESAGDAMRIDCETGR
jgi:hypothetical protein